jgi:hypothetical protein
MDEKQDATRCKQCDHLLSFHNEDGCGTWLLGVRAVPLYRCACVVSPTNAVKNFPVISSNTFHIASTVKFPNALGNAPTNAQSGTGANEAQVANLIPASESSTTAKANLRNRLNDLAEGLRRTAVELKQLEDSLDNTLRRLAPTSASLPAPLPKVKASFKDRRGSTDRRSRTFAMIAERRLGERRAVAA